MPDPIEAALARLRLGAQTRHVFLCGGGKCAPTEQAQASWDHLKRRLRELGLQDVPGGVLRTKADCLRVCTAGPIAVVYPEGTWYRDCTGDSRAPDRRFAPPIRLRVKLLREQGFHLEFAVYMGCVEGWDAKVRNLAGEKGVLVQERIISSPADALEFSNFMAIKPGSYRQVAPMILVDDSVNIPGYLGVVAIPNGLDTKLQKTPRGGVILENGDLRLYFGSPVYSLPGIRGEEAFSSSFQSLSADLFLVNLEVQDLTRIWLFLSALYSDYGSLNMARKKYYDRSLPLKGRRIPASTGIAGKNIYGSAVAAQCWAFSGQKIEIKRSFSQMQCEPSAYCVLFSRAIQVDFPENRLLLVSGTASIDAVGRTVHEGSCTRRCASPSRSRPSRSSPRAAETRTRSRRRCNGCSTRIPCCASRATRRRTRC